MRVLIAHNRYRSPGGEERHIDLLHGGLERAGVEVERFERDSANLVSARERMAASLNLVYSRKAERDFERSLAQFKPDVVHLHNLMPLLTPSVARAAKRAGAVVAMTFHNYRFACPSGTLLREGKPHDDCVTRSSFLCALHNPRGDWRESIAYGIALELQRRLRLLERWVDRFIVPSAFVGTMLERAGFPSERIRLVRYGIPLNGSTSSDASEGKGVLFAGRLSVEKGIDVLVRAAAHLPEIPFVVAGDGPLREAVESGPSNMKLIGHVSPTQLDEWRRRTAMTVVPSTCYEVSPFAALEALAQGQPVVGSRIGGIPEIVREGVSGVLVPPNEELPLVDAIRTLHADASRRVTLSERGRRLVESEYELECQTDRVLEAYGVTV